MLPDGRARTTLEHPPVRHDGSFPGSSAHLAEASSTRSNAPPGPLCKLIVCHPAALTGEAQPFIDPVEGGRGGRGKFAKAVYIYPRAPTRPYPQYLMYNSLLLLLIMIGFIAFLLKAFLCL